MTLEEAKDYIREWCPYDRQEEIIKALEQEPCGDAVSRQAVLDGIAIIAKAKAKSDAQKSLMGRVLFLRNTYHPSIHSRRQCYTVVTDMQTDIWSMIWQSVRTAVMSTKRVIRIGDYRFVRIAVNH